VTIDVPSTGKRRRSFVTVHGTKKDAQRRLAELLVSIDNGSYVKPKHLTVGEWLGQWLQGYVATNTAPRTRERYEEIVQLHLIPALGLVRLSALQPEHIQKYYADALESGRRDGKGGLSARTVHHHHRVLYEALRHAVKHGIIGRNPGEAVDTPRPRNREITMIGPSDVLRLLDAAKGTPYYPVLFTALYTGLRRGELLGLRWCDLDLDLATLSVVQTLQQLHNGQYVFREPKSRRGRRQIALSPSLAILLRQHRAKQEDSGKMLGKTLGPADLVFSHPDGTPLRPDSISRAFRTIARAVGLHGVRLHDLRHAHASLMLRQGVHPKIVSERLGHSGIAITIDTYSHVLPGLQEAAARRFEEGLQDVSVDVSPTGIG
jgi:integrase